MSSEIIIEKLVYRGYGMGHLNGKAVFVPFALPEEEVEIEITKDRKTHSFGEIKKVLSPSPTRVDPGCEFFYQCGGCSYRHLDYKEELRWKRLIFLELLGAHAPKEQEVHMHPCSLTKFYRNRMDFQVYKGRIGFYKRETRRLLEVDFCPLAEKPMNRALKEILLSGVFKKTSFSGRVSLMSSKKNVYLLLGKTTTPKKLTAAMKGLASLKGVAGVEAESRGKQKAQTKKEPGMTRTLNFFEKMEWEVSLPSFCQPNLFMNRKMIGLCLEAMKDSEKVLDLYSGTGNFSIPAATRGKEVTSVEANRAAIADLERAKERLALKNIEAVHSSALRFLKKGPGKSWDTVITDPPRKGMKEEAPLLADLEARTIIYVSCDPSAFARDAKTLIEKGYALKTSHILDMFPRTYHFETLNVFQKDPK